ncbi:outer membrane beta-barrel protein [Thalassospira sp.]|uniref:outer membrane beta-barrel protein n=1 Tax=Thalassospira sp. TaxID=1912094 RepID=UPI0027359AEF|nr:outer membrane beta-barrel protein [Thalassospira sp.]MDP2699134.1 outer membrane beta-barrel protein [Thalassospira sp.]
MAADRRWTGLVILPFVILGMEAANADEPRPGHERFVAGQTVRDRPQPAYDAHGLHPGSFVVFPSIALRETWDSNIYYQADAPRSDLITTASPKIDVRSQWSRHAMHLGADAEIKKFHDHSSENVENYALEGGLRFDGVDQSSLGISTVFISGHEDRSDPDSGGNIAPTPFRQISLESTLRYQPSVLSIDLSAHATRYDFDNGVRSDGSTIHNDDRDRLENRLDLKTGYTITPEYDAFARIAANSRIYDLPFDDQGINRSSAGWRGEGGIDLDLGGVIMGDIAFGLMGQNYEDPQFSDISGYAATANLYWHVTRLSTFSARFSRNINETSTRDASGYISSHLRLGIDHELLRNLVIGIYGDARLDDYRGISRQDRVFDTQLSADYRLDRHIGITTRLRHTTRNSDIASENYNRTAIELGLKWSI